MTKTMMFLLAATALTAPASAMERYGQVGGGTRSSIRDPDERLERLAAASTPNENGHGKPAKSVRGILRDDPYLRAAFASLDNK